MVGCVSLGVGLAVIIDCLSRTHSPHPHFLTESQLYPGIHPSGGKKNKDTTFPVLP